MTTPRNLDTAGTVQTYVRQWLRQEVLRRNDETIGTWTTITPQMLDDFQPANMWRATEPGTYQRHPRDLHAWGFRRAPRQPRRR